MGRLTCGARVTFYQNEIRKMGNPSFGFVWTLDLYHIKYRGLILGVLFGYSLDILWVLGILWVFLLLGNS